MIGILAVNSLRLNSHKEHSIPKLSPY
jgi:hypothetical protein